jgi:hypothetical protein
MRLCKLIHTTGIVYIIRKWERQNPVTWDQRCSSMCNIHEALGSIPVLLGGREGGKGGGRVARERERETDSYPM